MRTFDLLVTEELKNFDHARRPIKASERSAGDVPYLGASGVVDSVQGFTHDGDFLCVSEDGENLRSRKTPIAWVQRGRFWANNHLHVFGGLPLARLRFYAAALNRANIASYLTGSAQPKLSQQSLNAIPLPRCTPNEQIAIGEVLGALEDKINANQRLLVTVRKLAAACLEEAARDTSSAVTKVLGDVVTFHNRRRIPLSKNERSQRVGAVPYYGATGVVDWVDEPIFDEPLVLVGEDGTVVTETGRAVVQYIWGPAWVNNHAHVLSGNGISTQLLRHLIAQASVAERVTGAVQPKLSMGNLRAIEVVVPQGARLAAVEAAIAALTDREVAATEETRCLTATLNELLPLLLDGTLAVKDVTKHVKEEI